MQHFFGRIILTGIVVVVGVRSALAAGSTSLEQIRFFEEKVRPLLVENCLGCHGEKKQKGGYRLDIAAAALAGGDDGVTIIPKRGADSPLIQYVAGLDPDRQMPPKDALR